MRGSSLQRELYFWPLMYFNFNCIHLVSLFRSKIEAGLGEAVYETHWKGRSCCVVCFKVQLTVLMKSWKGGAVWHLGHVVLLHGRRFITSKHAGVSCHSCHAAVGSCWGDHTLVDFVASTVTPLTDTTCTITGKVAQSWADSSCALRGSIPVKLVGWWGSPCQGRIVTTVIMTWTRSWDLTTYTALIALAATKWFRTLVTCVSDLK